MQTEPQETVEQTSEAPAAATPQESHEQITERLRDAINAAWDALPKDHPNLNDYCYLSVNRSHRDEGGKIGIYLAGEAHFSIHSDTFQEVIETLGTFDPEAERREKIAKAKAELLKLQESIAALELADLKGGAL